MHKSSQTGTLRHPSGDCVEARDYVPRIFENEDYVFGSRTFSLLHLKSGGKTFTRDPSMRDNQARKRAKWLQTHYGISFKGATLLLSRGDATVRRVEETINGITDSLLLFDLELFKRGSNGRKSLTNIVRKILIIGTYNVGQVVKFWKTFTTFLYNRMAGFHPVLPSPKRENFFWSSLADHPLIRRIVDGDIDKTLLERFAHLSSTRQLPAGDRKEEAKALQSFLRNVEEPYSESADVLQHLHDIATRVGEKCAALCADKMTYPHISLSCAGSYYETVSDGGRGKEIRESLVRHLTVVPIEDETIVTPFGDLWCPGGGERWRYWCRETPYTHYIGTPFGSPITEEVFAEQNLFFQGFDEAIGCQILVVAYLEFASWRETSAVIPCRVLTVPEPGFKARIVTTGPFWLNVLQQGCAHFLKDILSHHPSSRSSLMKTDQAWQSLYLMSGKKYPLDFAVLSSDLKEATDHIPKKVAVLLFTGFISGCGLKTNLAETCLQLLKMDRMFITPESFSLRQERGIMMGEPLTKGLLTILNLCVEEAAMRDFLSVPPNRSFYKPPVWRTYHVGGDDHLAVGPPEYLRRITHYHRLWGSKISEGKHGISRKAVKYCEKMLDISNIYHPFDVRRINDSTASYESSPFVDSIKVRLLSPTAKAFDVSADRNIAIGKGLSLGRTLKWLNISHFPIKWVRMVRDRFFQRMGSLLPDRSSGVYWQLLLPNFWGGLGLYVDEDIPNLYAKIPHLTKSIMEDYLLEVPEAAEQIKVLGKFLTNYSYRGYRLNETEVSAMTSHIEIVIKQLMTKSWKQLVTEFDPEGTKSAMDLSHTLYTTGWRQERDVLDELLRPILFKEILLGIERPSPYNTEKLKYRYAKLWDRYYRGDSGLTLSDFRSLLSAKPKSVFYMVNYPEECHFFSDRGYLYKSALHDALNGMPVLRIWAPFA